MVQVPLGSGGQVGLHDGDVCQFLQGAPAAGGVRPAQPRHRIRRMTPNLTRLKPTSSDLSWLIVQLVRPTLCRLRQRGDAAGLTRRNALATSPGFSILLDVRQPDDGPRVDLARWGSCASRRPGVARPRGTSGATFPSHYRPSLPAGHRVVALEGVDGMPNPTPHSCRLDACVSQPGGPARPARAGLVRATLRLLM